MSNLIAIVIILTIMFVGIKVILTILPYVVLSMGVGILIGNILTNCKDDNNE